MFCRKCGKEIADSAAFCRFCGTPVACVNVQKPLPGSEEINRYYHSENDMPMQNQSYTVEQMLKNKKRGTGTKSKKLLLVLAGVAAALAILVFAIIPKLTGLASANQSRKYAEKYDEYEANQAAMNERGKERLEAEQNGTENKTGVAAADELNQE